MNRPRRSQRLQKSSESVEHSPTPPSSPLPASSPLPFRSSSPPVDSGEPSHFNSEGPAPKQTTRGTLGRQRTTYFTNGRVANPDAQRMERLATHRNEIYFKRANRFFFSRSHPKTTGFIVVDGAGVPDQPTQLEKECLRAFLGRGPSIYGTPKPQWPTLQTMRHPFGREWIAVAKVMLARDPCVCNTACLADIDPALRGLKQTTLTGFLNKRLGNVHVRHKVHRVLCAIQAQAIPENELVATVPGVVFYVLAAVLRMTDQVVADDRESLSQELQCRGTFGMLGHLLSDAHQDGLHEELRFTKD